MSINLGFSSDLNSRRNVFKTRQWFTAKLCSKHYFDGKNSTKYDLAACFESFLFHTWFCDKAVELQ